MNTPLETVNRLVLAINQGDLVTAVAPSTIPGEHSCWALSESEPVMLLAPSAESGDCQSRERRSRQVPFRSVSSCITLLVWFGTAELQAQNVWDQADRATRRLPPSAFENLPAPVRADLERRSCTIPQVWHDSIPGNVANGEFHRPGQTDWAVLCSVGRRSAILVYQDGMADSVEELSLSPDKDYLQGVGNGRIGFSRAIGIARPGFIRQAYEQYGGLRPPPLDHAGINDAFVEKGSVIWYWHRGKWMRLTGSD
jgi:hypothetical protein